MRVTVVPQFMALGNDLIQHVRIGCAVREESRFDVQFSQSIEDALQNFTVS
ncbi:hypothetical protein SDC9_116152 [bioreactor metagenome]|uniref:Uncharacterized protein n=1 Tax=bioreactor metagenome TaxID=1076179 RepID=A0A645BVT0_9ZZZZ